MTRLSKSGSSSCSAKLCTLTPSSRTGRTPASVLSSSCTARATISLLSRGRRGRGLAACDGREIRVADLDRHRPRQQGLARQPVGGVCRHLGDLRANGVEIGQVVRDTCSRCRTTWRRGGGRRADRRCRRRAGAASRRGCRRPPAAPGCRSCGRPRAARCRCARSLRAVTGPDAPQRVHRQLLQERLDALGADHRQAVGLLPAGGDLGEKLVRRDAGRRRQPRRLADACLQPFRDGRRQRLRPRRSP